MWYYEQKTGKLLHNGELIATGYSGHGEGKNNPEMQNVHAVGPIPSGLWHIGKPFNSPDHGPFVLRLTPAEETEAFGRDGFLMHGDSIKAPGSASLGCIIMPRWVREKVSVSGEDLTVVSGKDIQGLKSL